MKVQFSGELSWLFSPVPHRRGKYKMNRYVANTEYVLRNIAGDYILYKWENGGISNQSVIVFNETGAFLWGHLSSPQTETQLAELLCNAFNVNKEKAYDDVSIFITKCLEESILIKQVTEE
jgi:hypothetical protein